MILVDLLGWWYSRGWAWAAQYFFVMQSNKILSSFSIGSLLKTLFSPFRQDSLQLQNAPIGIRLQAFGGNIISRIFGAIIRSLLIISGGVLLFLNAALAVVISIIWPLIPVSPIIVALLIFTGVGL